MEKSVKYHRKNMDPHWFLSSKDQLEVMVYSRPKPLMIILEETRNIIGNKINYIWFLPLSNTANNNPTLYFSCINLDNKHTWMKVFPKSNYNFPLVIRNSQQLRAPYS